MKHSITIEGVIVDNQLLTLDEFIQATQAPKTQVLTFIEYELIAPKGDHPDNWQFDSACLSRARTTLRLYHDLNVNYEGASVALDLLEQIQTLKEKIQLLKKQLD